MIIEGYSTFDSVEKFLHTLNNDDVTIDGNLTDKLRKDIETWKENMYDNYSKGLLGAVICGETREVNEYTWSFGQNTKRRLSKFKKSYVNNYDIEEEGGDILMLCLTFGNNYWLDDEEEPEDVMGCLIDDN